MNKEKLTSIASLGEFGLIDRLTRRITIHQKDTVKGVGDDTAVIDAGEDYLLVTKDLLVEGIHFDMVYSPLKHLGYKAVTVNLSDIYAMNGVPRQIVVGLAVSSRYSLEAMDALYEGMLLACDKYGVDMVGGDTVSSPSGMILSITALGRVPKDQVVYRKGAAENDVLCVTGDLGAAYCGLLVLEREKQVFRANPEMQPDIGAYSYVLERQLKPEAGRQYAEALAKAGVKPSSMIDISDGLSSEVLHLCKNSGLSAVVYEERIPVHPAMAQTAHEFNIDPTTAALNGGEDYELLFTCSPFDYEKIKDIPGISAIGHMKAAGTAPVLVTTSGQYIEITAQGWEGF